MRLGFSGYNRFQPSGERMYPAITYPELPEDVIEGRMRSRQKQSALKKITDPRAPDILYHGPQVLGLTVDPQARYAEKERALKIERALRVERFEEVMGYVLDKETLAGFGFNIDRREPHVAVEGGMLSSIDYFDVTWGREKTPHLGVIVQRLNQDGVGLLRAAVISSSSTLNRVYQSHLDLSKQ